MSGWDWSGRSLKASSKFQMAAIDVKRILLRVCVLRRTETTSWTHGSAFLDELLSVESQLVVVESVLDFTAKSNKKHKRSCSCSEMKRKLFLAFWSQMKKEKAVGQDAVSVFSEGRRWKMSCSVFLRGFLASEAWSLSRVGVACPLIGVHLCSSAYCLAMSSPVFIMRSKRNDWTALSWSL